MYLACGIRFLSTSSCMSRAAKACNVTNHLSRQRSVQLTSASSNGQYVLESVDLYPDCVSECKLHPETSSDNCSIGCSVMFRGSCSTIVLEAKLCCRRSSRVSGL